MALSPFQPPEDRANVVETTTEPGYTFEFDFTTKQFTGQMIDDSDALRQFILKAILTTRFRYLIYTDAYGSEIETLIEDDATFAYAESEMKRFVFEAIAFDDRVQNVHSFHLYQVQDELYCDFVVVPVEGIEFQMRGVNMSYGTTGG